MTGQLSILTFNIAHGRGLSLYQGIHSKRNIEKKLDRIAHMLSSQNPDIVALQEADVGSHWNHGINTVERIRHTAGYSYSEEGVHNLRHGKKPLAYGNAVLSRYPVHFSETIPFGTKELGEKGFMIASVEAFGSVHTIINLHLDYKSRTKRIEQIEILLEKIESAGLPEHPIICGDFNSSSKGEMDAVHHLLSFMRRYDVYELYPSGGKTFPAHFPVRGLDFILIPSRYRVKECCIVKSYLSDHRPVKITLEFC